MGTTKDGHADIRLAPGYQARLFSPGGEDGRSRWRVVDRWGRRGSATTSLVLAVGRARALAMADGRAWLVGSGEEAVEVAFADGSLVVSPRGPGSPATCQRILAEHGLEQAYAEAVAGEDAKGTRVVESVRAGNNQPLGELGFTEEAHRSEACHAVAVERRWRDVEVVPVCTEPRRHTTKGRAKDRSELQGVARLPPPTCCGSPSPWPRAAWRKRSAATEATGTESVRTWVCSGGSGTS